MSENTCGALKNAYIAVLRRCAALNRVVRPAWTLRAQTQTAQHTRSSLAHALRAAIPQRLEPLEPRLLYSATLFAESFDTTAFDAANWASVSTATIDDQGINVPSAPFAARLNGQSFGGDTITSVVIDLSTAPASSISYAYQRTGLGNSTEAGDDLILEYLNDSSVWVELDRQLGSGPDMTTFEAVEINLPTDAAHANFQFRFRNIATVGPFDDWFVDDITIQARFASISGTAFEDLNGDGTRDPDEGPLAGVTVYLDLDDNDQLDSGEPNTLTAADGSYTFTQLEPGSYVVRQLTPASYTLTSPGPRADGTFAAPLSSPTGSALTSLVTGDFNGDGTLDLAAVDNPNDAVAVMFGTGNGTFATPITIAVEEEPTELVTSDFNGDGALDIAVISDGPFQATSFVVSALMNDGTGSFTVQTSPSTLGRPLSIVAGRFDLGFTTDLVVTTSGGLSLLSGNGNGTFSLANATPFMGQIGGFNTAAADFNSDGRLDVVVADVGASDVAVYERNFSGQFLIQQIPLNVGLTPVAVNTGDFNSDGIVDVVTVNRISNNLSVLLGVGDGTLNPDSTFSIGNSPRSVTVSDLNGDGILDLATANGFSNDASLLLGNGDGTFAPAVQLTAGNTPTAIVSGDFNADGIPDLAVANSLSGDVSVFLGNTRPAGVYSIAVGPNEHAIDVDFGYEPLPSSISGTKFEDLNANGTQDPGEDPLEGVTIYLDLNDNAALDPGEPQTLTATDGTYTFTGLAPGDYAVREVVPQGYAQTTPALDPQLAFDDALTSGVVINPDPLTIGDFDNDGIPDLATANFVLDFGYVAFGNGDGTFDASLGLDAGNGPTDVAAGDFDNDGIDDLVFVNRLSLNSLSVYTSNGDRTFAPANTIATDDADAVTTADLNGDGNLDLATVNRTNGTATVLLGDGNGNFTPLATTLTAGVLSNDIISDDFNNDGVPDLAVANSTSDDVSVFLGNGDGTFASAITLAAGSEPQALVSADFNGDGNPDLATANRFSDDASVFLGNGDGTFAAEQRLAGSNNNASIEAGDFDGDGSIDLAISSRYAAGALVLLGQGNGDFDAALQIAPTSFGGRSVKAGDFDGDGRTDLVTSNYGSNRVTVLLNATLSGGANHLTLGPDENATGADFGNQPLPGSISGSKFEDLNGNGFQDPGEGPLEGVTIYLDLNDNATLDPEEPQTTTAQDGTYTFTDLQRGDYVIREVVHAGYVQTSPVIGDGTFAAQERPDLNTKPQASVATDINGDGWVDIVTANYTDSLSVLINDGTGSFTADQSIEAGGSPVALSAADLNADGIPDLVTANIASSDVSVFLGNANGTFDPQVRYAVGANPNSIEFGDFNGDGVLDLATTNPFSSDLSVLLGQGDGTFGAEHRFSAFAPPLFFDSPDDLVVGDFNGDGISDLATANSQSGSVRLLIGAGDGTFSPPLNFDAIEEADTLQAADFNNDGALDLVTASRQASEDVVEVLLGNGDGTFMAAARVQITSTGLSPIVSAVIAGDFNDDGAIDLATSNALTNDISVVLGNGDGTFSLSPVASRFGVGTQPNTILAADFDGDGTLDLATTNELSDDVSTLRGVGNGLFGLEVRTSIAVQTPTLTGDDLILGVGPISTLFADLNQDGLTDLVASNASSQTVSVLLGQGDGVLSPETTFAIGGPPASVTTGDFDGDGQLDLVTANSGSISILIGNGSGGFGTSQLIPSGDGTSVATGDLNDDGNLDVVTGNDFSEGISIHLGNGDGTFAAVQSVKVRDASTNDRVTAVFLEDLDGDGVLDLGATTMFGELKVLSGNGDGTFAPPQNIEVGDDPLAALAADLNDDGIPDVVTANRFSDDISILLGTGDGSFTPQQRIDVPGGPAALTSGDFNDDGRVDLAVAAERRSDVTLLTQLSDGTFALAQAFDVDLRPNSLTTGDLNGDGVLDLATGTGFGITTTIALGNTQVADAIRLTLAPGEDATAPAFGNQPLPGSISGTKFEDLNANGTQDPGEGPLAGVTIYLDLNDNAALDPEETQTTTAADGSYTFSDLQRGDYTVREVVPLGFTQTSDRVIGDGTLGNAQRFNTGSQPDGVAIGDLNGDGFLDVVTANNGSDDFSILLGNGDGTFATQPALSSSDAPRSVTLIDVNGDGFLDIAAAHLDADQASIRLGNGDGTFGSETRFATGDRPSEIAAIDLNGDLQPDLITVNRDSDDISVLLGNGDGTFAPAQQYDTGTDFDRLAVGDLNGDGSPDVVIADTSAGVVAVLINAGDANGTLGPQTDLSVGSFPAGLDLSDFNGDGFLDIATSNLGSSDVSVLIGNGDGTFNAEQSIPAGTLPQDVAGTDFNGDGIDDLVVVNRITYTASVFISNGDGSFGAAQTFATDGSFPYDIATADFNGDGINDLITTNFFSDDVSVLLGNAQPQLEYTLTLAPGQDLIGIDFSNQLTDPATISGTKFEDLDGDGFRDPGEGPLGGVTIYLDLNDNAALDPGEPQTTTAADGTYTFDPLAPGDYIVREVVPEGFIQTGPTGADGTFRTSNRFDAGGDPASVVTADLNGDGILDVATANRDANNVSILLGSGDGTFTTAISYAAGTSPVSITQGDFNGDGFVDLAIANAVSDDVSVLLGNGDGTFATAVSYTVREAPNSIATADFNGDGFADLAVAGYSYVSTQVLFGNGDGTFTVADEARHGGVPRFVTAADFNDDGFVDLAAVVGETNVVIHLNDSNGSFPSLTRTTLTAGLGPAAIAIGDFNGDGTPDFATANRNSDDISVFVSNGDGTFTTAIAFAAGNAPVSITAIDLNADGVLDLATANELSDDVSILLGNGDATFRAPATTKLLVEPGSIVAGDFDADGVVDLITANEDSNDITVLLGNRDGTLDAQAGIVEAGTPNSLALADFNNDGNADLATANAISNNVSVILGDDTGEFTNEITYAVGGAPEAVTVGDLNGDGFLDLTTANPYTDNLSVLLGNGDGTFAPAATYAAGNDPLAVVIGDFNVDGSLDLAVANELSDDISVLLGNGDGTLATAVSYTAGIRPAAITLGDFNGDGVIDLATA
ncbi:MAG: FG-GAP-like repeat-containing protein, partial [Planctomycetota bacterium]